MKIITLAAPTVVNTHPRNLGDGELRYPSEGGFMVCDDEAKRLKDNNLLAREPDAAGNSDGEEGDGLDGMKIADLHLLVTKEGIPLHDARKKHEIIAAIRKHRAGGSDDKPDYERDSLKDIELAAASKNQLLVIAAYEQADVPQGDAATEDELRSAITTKRAA